MLHAHDLAMPRLLLSDHAHPVSSSRAAPASARTSATWQWAVGPTAVATILGILGLLGWISPWRELASFSASSIPMAPLSGVAILLLGSAALCETQWPSRARTATAALVVLAVTLHELVLFLAGLPQWLDALLVPAPPMLGAALTGRMLPLTAGALLLASVGLLLVALSRRSAVAGAAVGTLGSIVCLVGSLVALGYAYRAPLLYGGSVVPMALPTALAVTSLGLGLLGLAPRGSFPVRLVIGSSANARLLRAFLPIAPLGLLVDLALHQFELNQAIHAALEALLAATVVTAVVFLAARAVAQQLDLAESERERARRDIYRLAAIVECSSDAIWAKDLKGTIVAWNPSAERLFGYSAAEMIGQSASRLLPPGIPDDLPVILGRLERGERIEHNDAVRVGKDGAPLTVFVSESPLRDAHGGIAGVSTIARDITQQRRSERILLETEKKLQAMFESDVVGILFGDAQGGTEANDEFLRMTGYTREDLRAGRFRWDEITPAEFRARDEAARAEALARGACTPYEKQYFRKDGTRCWVLVGYALMDRLQERSVGFVLDIDTRKRAEHALRQSEERFAKVFESSLIAIGIAERNTGRIIDVNDRYAEFFGYRRDEMVGHTLLELGAWVDLAERERIVAGLASDPSVYHAEARFRRKSGETRHALLSVEKVVLTGVKNPANLIVLVDLTERRQLEAQLHQAQKMEAIGRLAGGVAHDFNNLLGVILGYGEILMRGLPSGPQQGKLEEILKAGERAAGLTRQLLAFSRKQNSEPKVVDLNVLLSDLEKMLGRLIGEDIDVVIVPGADLGQVKADPGQVEQIVMNLCVNARDAMPDGGLLRIETANAELDQSYAMRHEPLAPGRYVMLSVSDTGCGIEPELLDKVFEPFFTTKEKGKGTGLGLASVYGIVKQAGGYVWVYSHVGQGTTFKIYLPRIDAPIDAAARVETALPRGGSETILLAEDEASLREISCEILRESGYQVIEASGGSEAIDIARRHEGPIHLLVTDVVMPDTNGRALAEALMAVRPEMKVLYMSGYTDDVIASRGILEPGFSFINKPFTALALLDCVRKVLDERNKEDQA